jgi:signal transduction histidine kinase
VAGAVDGRERQAVRRAAGVRPGRAVAVREPAMPLVPPRDHAGAGSDFGELESLRRLVDGREQLCLVLEEVLEASTDGIVALDFRGRTVHVSESLRESVPAGDGALDRSGSARTAPVSPGESLPRSVERRLRREAAALRAGETRRFDLRWLRPDRGTERYRVTATAGSDPAGEGRLLTLFTFFDRTRDAALERELAEARNLAALGQMAATVAHELRNPLGAIQGFAGLLSRDLAGQPALLRQAERILRGVERANQIVSDLLEYTRPVAPRREPVSLESLLAESVAALRASTLSLDSVEVDLRVDPELPAALCDSRLVQQALHNLYANAIQAMGGEGTLSVRARAAGPTARPDRLRVVVRDTGCGLEADEVARIFQPFYTTCPGGTGLGLPLVRRIVEAHGGHVHVVSAPGRGTSVVIDLPAAGREQPGGREGDDQEEMEPAGEELAA